MYFYIPHCITFYVRSANDTKVLDNGDDAEPGPNEQLTSNNNIENTDNHAADNIPDTRVVDIDASNEEPLPHIVTEGKDFRIQIPERVYLDRCVFGYLILFMLFDYSQMNSQLTCTQSL